jgi:hypothetical protein
MVPQLKIKIKERSWFARLAAKNLGSQRMAAVLGRTVHLWNVSREEFLSDPAWVVHELEHVRQFKRYGFLRFSILYLLEYRRHGYEKNRFEVEARIAEAGIPNLEGIEFL